MDINEIDITTSSKHDLQETASMMSSPTSSSQYRSTNSTEKK